MGHDAQTPAEVIYTFGALRTQFSLPQTSKNSHKNSYFMQLWGEKKPWVMWQHLCLIHLTRVAGWRGHTKGHWISVYIRTGFCDAVGLSGSGIFANACTPEQTTSFSITGQSSACLLACKWTGKRAAWRTDRLCSPQQQDELAPRGCHAEIRLGFIIWAARWRTNTLNPSLLCFKWSAVIHNSNKCSWLSPDIA